MSTVHTCRNAKDRIEYSSVSHALLNLVKYINSPKSYTHTLLLDKHVHKLDTDPKIEELVVERNAKYSFGSELMIYILCVRFLRHRTFLFVNYFFF